MATDPGTSTSHACLLCEKHGDMPIELETEDRLREHLIESHSESVCKGFLYPQIGDPIHMWLMTCVKYQEVNDNANDLTELLANINENSPSSNETAEETALKEKVDDDLEGIIDLSTVISAIFESQKETFDVNEILKNGLKEENGLKRKNSTTLSSAGEPQQKKGDNKKMDKLAVAIGVNERLLVDSKAKNKLSCTACGLEVCNTARQRHVFLLHVRKEDMYKCPICFYSNSNSIWETKRHCHIQHGPGIEPINNEEKYKDLIVMWNRRCFPEWRHKKPYSWEKGTIGSDSADITNSTTMTTSSTVDGSMEEDKSEDFTSMCRDAIFKEVVEEEASDEGLDEQEDTEPVDFDLANLNAMIEMARNEANSAAAEPTTDDRMCWVCNEESKYPGRHIAQKHLQGHLYECPLCDQFGSYEACTVAKHIKRVHPEASDDVKPISNLLKYREVIRDWQQRCFPNRPMKLVKNPAFTKCRDRHTCLMCGTKVAQSDRQRHVYQHHLKKDKVFECPACTYSTNYDIHRMKWHLRWIHKSERGLEPISHEHEYRDEIEQLNEQCFPNWNHRLKTPRSPDSGVVADEESPTTLQPPTTLPVIKQEVEDDHSEVLSATTKDNQAGAPSVGQRMNRVSEWTCRLCNKEFKPTSNFMSHVAKEHLEIPLFQCPVCDHGSADAIDIKAHILQEHDDAQLEAISNLEARPDYVQQRFLLCFPNRPIKLNADNNLDSTLCAEDKIVCNECCKEMKPDDRQIHVYRHHLKEPRLFECPLCDYAHYACSSEIRVHMKLQHRETGDLAPRCNLEQHADKISEWNERCFPGWVNRKLPNISFEDCTRCKLCDVEVRQTSRHIAEVHLKMNLHVCPLCKDFGAPEVRTVRKHIKKVHKDEKSEPLSSVLLHKANFSALHDKCFPARPKRHSTISKPSATTVTSNSSKCEKCDGTISNKRRLAHALAKHLNRAAYECAHCVYAHTCDESAVATHMKAEHKGLGGKPRRLFAEFSSELEETASCCFPEWDYTVEFTNLGVYG